MTVCNDITVLQNVSVCKVLILLQQHIARCHF